MLDDGEDARQAATREVAEELGLDVEVGGGVGEDRADPVAVEEDADGPAPDGAGAGHRAFVGDQARAAAARAPGGAPARGAPSR